MPRKRQAATPPPERDLSQVNLIKTAMLEMLLVHPRAIWVHCDFPPSDMERYAPDDRCPVVGTIGIPTTVQPYLPILDALRIHAFRAIQHSDPVSIGLIGTTWGWESTIVKINRACWRFNNLGWGIVSQLISSQVFSFMLSVGN